MGQPRYIEQRSLMAGDIQTEIKRVVDKLRPIAEGVVLTSVPVGTTETAVPHPLGEPPTGWFRVSPTGTATVTQSSAPDRNALYLIATSPVTVTLVVF